MPASPQSLPNPPPESSGTDHRFRPMQIHHQALLGNRHTRFARQGTGHMPSQTQYPAALKTGTGVARQLFKWSKENKQCEGPPLPGHPCLGPALTSHPSVTGWGRPLRRKTHNILWCLGLSIPNLAVRGFRVNSGFPLYFTHYLTIFRQVLGWC